MNQWLRMGTLYLSTHYAIDTHREIAQSAGGGTRVALWYLGNGSPLPISQRQPDFEYGGNEANQIRTHFQQLERAGQVTVLLGKQGETEAPRARAAGGKR